MSGMVPRNTVEGHLQLAETWWTVVFWCCYLIEVGWRKYVSPKWVVIGSADGWSPVRGQAITWTNYRITLIGPLWYFSVKFVLKYNKFHWGKLSSVMWQQFCFGGLNVLYHRWMVANFASHNMLKHLAVEIAVVYHTLSKVWNYLSIPRLQPLHC